METNIDDSTEKAGIYIGVSIGGGSKDAFYEPIYMKKNRPI